MILISKETCSLSKNVWHMQKQLNDSQKSISCYSCYHILDNFLWEMRSERKFAYYSFLSNSFVVSKCTTETKEQDVSCSAITRYKSALDPIFKQWSLRAFGLPRARTRQTVCCIQNRGKWENPKFQVSKVNMYERIISNEHSKSSQFLLFEWSDNSGNWNVRSIEYASDSKSDKIGLFEVFVVGVLSPLWCLNSLLCSYNKYLCIDNVAGMNIREFCIDSPRHSGANLILA